ncbi:hypothetical protein NXS98_17615 [Fontisphaera persica]|uniref:hypothetical protein n=1 Tax=Fontisphaera persica TaxID=2974023 RepID=UPI0024C051CE|nr:hypothetical protein [Fontisphaera persica]WCJ59510.1 hypothetical protein NXS98_17615 [Fontisphaera persica]
MSMNVTKGLSFEIPIFPSANGLIEIAGKSTEDGWLGLPRFDAHPAGQNLHVQASGRGELATDESAHELSVQGQYRSSAAFAAGAVRKMPVVARLSAFRYL